MRLPSIVQTAVDHLWTRMLRFTCYTFPSFKVSLRLVIFVILSSLDGAGSVLQAAEKDPFDAILSNKVVELSMSQHCKEAWTMIWPQVRRGSNKATLQLIGEMTWGNIQPPLSSPDEGTDSFQHDTIRFLADIVFLVDPSKNSNDAEKLASVKREILRKVWDKKSVSAYEYLKCPTGGDKNVCLNPEKWPGMVTKLADWDKKFRENELAGLIARCRRKNG